MKRNILIGLLVLLVAASICCCLLTDRLSLPAEQVHSIDVKIAGSDTERTFTVTQTDQVAYITDYLNRLILLPGGNNTASVTYTLILRDADGAAVAELTCQDREAITISGKTYAADLNELCTNLNNISSNMAIKTKSQFLPLYLLALGVFVVILALSMGGAYVVQNALCQWTTVPALRLVPMIVVAVLYLVNLRFPGLLTLLDLIGLTFPILGKLMFLDGILFFLCILAIQGFVLYQFRRKQK